MLKMLQQALWELETKHKICLSYLGSQLVDATHIIVLLMTFSFLFEELTNFNNTWYLFSTGLIARM